MSKIIISFGAKWNNVRIAVNPKDLARTLEFIEGLDFVESASTAKHRARSRSN